MNTSALILMFAAEGIIAAITIYFFIRVLNTPPRAEPDSYTGNDNPRDD
jgi:hypothetical protein